MTTETMWVNTKWVVNSFEFTSVVIGYGITKFHGIGKIFWVI